MTSRLPQWITIPRIAALTVLVFVVLLVFLTKAMVPPEFDFLAGPENSTFYRDAMRFKDILERDGVRLNVIETRGSLENLRLLAEAEEPTAGFVDAAGAIEVVERDPGEETEEDPEEIDSPLDGLTSLGAIYLQPIWFFTATNSELTGVEEMHDARLGVGPKGSTSRVIAELLRRNVSDDVNIEFVSIAGEDDVIQTEEVLDALLSGEVQAVVTSGQPQNRLVDRMLRSPDIRVANIRRAEAYALHFPYLVPVSLPEGGYDLGDNIPDEDISTLAASTELVVTELFPAPLADLLLQATSEVHGDASLFTERDAFPNPDMVSVNLSTSALRFYESGPPLLRKYLPFQLATWIDRFIMVVVGFGSIAFALFSILPKLVEMHLDRQLQAAYRRMEDVEKRFFAGGEPDKLLGELDAVDAETRDIRIYLRGTVSSWLEMRQFLHDLRERIGDEKPA
jgi:TRAP-type uncharacterized transport system substrate-binding protein